MTNLPSVGDKVHVWPMPGRMVQDGARPLDSGGRWLPPEGRDVIWTEYHHEQYRQGDLLLHEPPKAKAAEKPAETAPPPAPKA